MTTAKALEKAFAVLRSLPEDEQKRAEYVLNDPQKWTIPETAVILSEFIKELREDLAKETTAKSGKKSIHAAALRILKRGASRPQPSLHYAYTTPSGDQIICDGCSLVKLSEPLPLPELPEKIEPVNYSRIIPETIPAENIELPDRAKLRAYIKQCKAEKKTVNNKRVLFDFGDGLPVVDAELLADVIECVPGATKAANDGILRAVYVRDDGAFGMLIPLKPKDGKRARTVL